MANITPRETNCRVLTTHGQSKTKLYKVWNQMKQRCSNPKSKGYHNYGGKGISVCKEWQDDFNVFHSWALQNGYEIGKEIHRVNSNGNYSPENCVFIEKSIHRREHKEALDKEQKEEVIRLYKRGASLREIGRIFGKSHNVIKHHIKSSGLEIRRFGANPEEIDEAVEAFYNTNISARELSRVSGISRYSIDKHIMEAR